MHDNNNDSINTTTIQQSKQSHSKAHLSSWQFE